MASKKYYICGNTMLTAMEEHATRHGRNVKCLREILGVKQEAL